MNLGERLYELRKAKNLTQDDVAEKLNVSRQTVSKWETNQSTPDFDKIVPLCELFEIGVEELLTGKKPEPTERKEEKVLTRQELKEKSAKVVSTSVFLYIFSVVVLIVATSFGVDSIIATGIFLLIIAWATARIVYHYMSHPKLDEIEEVQTEEEMKKEKKQNTLQKQINEIIMSIATAIYFIVSFLTMAWHITWLIFIIASLICQVVKLIFLLKGDEKNEE